MARASLGSAVWTLEADSTPLARALRSAEGLVTQSAFRIDTALSRVSHSTTRATSSMYSMREAARHSNLAFKVLGETMALTDAMWLSHVRNAGQLVVVLGRIAAETMSVAHAAKTATVAQEAMFITPAFQSLLYASFDATTLRRGAGGRFARGTGAGPGRDFATAQRNRVLDELGAMEKSAPRIPVTWGDVGILAAARYLPTLSRAFIAPTGAARQLAMSVAGVVVKLGLLGSIAGGVVVAGLAVAGAALYSHWKQMKEINRVTEEAVESEKRLAASIPKVAAERQKAIQKAFEDSKQRSNQLREGTEDLRLQRLRGEASPSNIILAKESAVAKIEEQITETETRMAALRARLQELALPHNVMSFWRPTEELLHREEIFQLERRTAELREQQAFEQRKSERELADLIAKRADAQVNRQIAFMSEVEQRHKETRRLIEQEDEARQRSFERAREHPPGGESVATIRRLTSGLVSARAYAGISGAIGSGTPEDKQLSEQKRTNALLMQLVRQRGGLRN